MSSFQPVFQHHIPDPPKQLSLPPLEKDDSLMESEISLEPLKKATFAKCLIAKLPSSITKSTINKKKISRAKKSSKPHTTQKQKQKQKKAADSLSDLVEPKPFHLNSEQHRSVERWKINQKIKTKRKKRKVLNKKKSKKSEKPKKSAKNSTQARQNLESDNDGLNMIEENIVMSEVIDAAGEEPIVKVCYPPEVYYHIFPVFYRIQLKLLLNFN